MNDFGWIYDVLEIRSPWRVLEVRDDLRDRQLDLWIGTEPVKKSWIFGRAQPAGNSEEHVWRHTNLGALRCVIHAEIPVTVDTTGLHWCGDAGAPFTRTLARKVGALISEGVPLHHICGILDVAVEELWKFRYGLDKGQSGLPANMTAEPAIAPPQPKGSVPEPDDPVWQALLEGTVRIDIRVLGLKLFLAKLREQMQSIKDDEVRTLKCYELQRYFARNENYLGQELTQLRKH